MYVICTNTECSENGVHKNMLPGSTPPPPEMVISCGVCGKPCERHEDEPEPEPEPPDRVDNTLPTPEPKEATV